MRPGYPAGFRSCARHTPVPLPPRPSPSAKRRAPSSAASVCGLPSRASSARPSANGSPGALERRTAIGEHRLLREGGDPLGHRERAPHVLAGRDDLVHKADLLRLAGVEHAPAEDHVERAAHPHDAGQPLGAAVDQRDAEAALGEAQARGLGRHPQVAPQRQLEAAGQAPAGDRGDRGLGRDEPREAQRALGGVEAVAQRLERLEVGAGAERQLAAPVRTRTRAVSSAAKRA